jgi:acyl carrier protein
MHDELTGRVIRVIAETQKIPPETIQPASTFAELKIDSLDGINIMFGLENEFNINIPDDTARELRTVGDVVEGIRKLTAGGDGPAPAGARA